MAGEKVIVYIGGKKRYIPLPAAEVSPTVVAQAVSDYLIANPPTGYTHPSSHPATIITVDDTHQWATNAEKQAWDGKATIAEVKEDTEIVGVINNSHAPGFDNQVIPDQLSDLSDDTTHRLVTDTEKSTWGGKQDALSSGTNIKTINGVTILGSGDMTVGGSSAVSWGKYF